LLLHETRFAADAHYQVTLRESHNFLLG
jgi:hypothetical protein